jgi:hypothetical protein
MSYYKTYRSLHTKEGTRAWHLIGNLCTVAYIVTILVHPISLWWLLLSPLVVYPFAWGSHKFIEKNKPAAFSNPIKAKLADWRMMWETLTR